MKRRLLRWLAVCLLGGLIVLGTTLAAVEVNASYQLRAADEALSRQNYAEARRRLESALPARRNSTDVHLRLARVCRQGADLRAAGEHLDRCKELGGGSSDEYRLERLLLNAQAGGGDEDLETLNRLVGADGPDTPLVLEGLCLTLMRRAWLAPALGFAERWLRRQPDNVQALFIKGMCLSQLGRWEPAAACLRPALDRDPTRDDVRQALAAALLDLSRYAEAAPLAESVLSRQPDNVGARLILARCLCGRGQPEEALALLDQLLEADSQEPEVLAERGRLALSLGDAAGAERWLTRALALDPQGMTTAYQLVACLNRLGKTREADELAAKTRALEGDNLRITELLTHDLFEKGDTSRFCQELGVLLLRTGRQEPARYWLYRALRFDPSFAPAHATLAEYWDRVGDREQADFHRKAVERLHPSLP